MDEQSRRVLRGFFLFQGLSGEEQEKLFNLLPEPATYAKGEVLFSREHFKKSLGILLEGEAKVHRYGDDRVILNRLTAGSAFGAAALYGDAERYLTEIRAASPALALFLTQELLSRLMRDDYRIAENYIRFLSGRIRFLNERIAGFTGDSAARRVADYFSQHRREDGRVDLPGSMVELSKVLGIGRTSLYRAVDSLEQSGVLRKDGRTYYMDQQQADACWID